jgi:cytochrome c-type biogenesis protein CcmE
MFGELIIMEIVIVYYIPSVRTIAGLILMDVQQNIIIFILPQNK